MAARGEPSLTDSELRNELQRLGFSAGPITATTRSLLLKKLDKLKDEEKKKSRRTTLQKISSAKIFGLSSDESEGEAAGNSRGTAPVNVARRRSGARTPRAAPNKTTKRLSVGGKTSQSAKNTRSRRSLAAEANESDGNEDDNNFENDDFVLLNANKQRFDRTYNKQNDNENQSSTAVNSRTGMGGRRTIRPVKGDGDNYSNNANSEQVGRTREFSDSDGEMLSQRGVKTRVKKHSSNSRTPGAIVRNRRTVANDDEDAEEDDDDSASDNSGKRSSSIGVTDKKEDSTSMGRWSFLTRRKTARSDTPPKVTSDVSKDEENTSVNWTILPSPFHSSRTSTPRKASASVDDTTYHTVPGNSTSTRDTSANAVATPISGRPTLRGSTLNMSSGNHTSFLGQTPPTTGNNSSRREDTMPLPNESLGGNIAQTPMKEMPLDEAQIFATEENLGSSWKTKYSHFVSMVLVGSVVLFFILLAFMYLNVNSTVKSGRLQIADITGGDNVDFSGDELPLMMAQALYDKLTQMSGDYLCGKSLIKNMSMEEARIYLEENLDVGQVRNRKPFWIAEYMPRTVQLITTHPQWALRLYGESGELITEYSYENNVAWLDTSHVNMSLYCQVKTTALTLLFWVSLLIFSLLLLWPAHYLVKYQMQRKEQERLEVTQLVERIIEVLANHQQACYQNKSLTPYLAIPHVRDTLIPPAERHKKQHLWQKAVQFLNVNESRVRVETQQVAGEEFAVWRWVQPSPAVAVTSFLPITDRDMNPKRAKVWQGTAFANLDTAVKASPHSYTPCLKVRNMFDITLESGSNWHVTIEDAILERCGENSGIVHITVDKNSREGCVYVKCVSAEKAGMAFRCLQGSWFDGKLVTVKYIRLDRYHQRFPQALNIIAPLKPSNNLRISLQPLPGCSC